MKIVLLSGGSGQRLWPLSNDYCSKQYINFVDHDSEVVPDDISGKCSMLKRVYEQLISVGMAGNVLVAASEAQRELVYAQLGDKVVFSAEPMRRDTFPAVLIASSFCKSNLGCDMDEVVAFMPIDPYVSLDYFRTILRLGAEIKRRPLGIVGLMGATPTYPSEKYGYILGNWADEGIINVMGFAEKPNADKAAELIAGGALWNCGVFCFKIGTAVKWAEKYNLPFDYNTIFAEHNYMSLPKRSFDYEILENTKDIIALSYSGMWKDIGTWNTLTEEMHEQSIGKVVTYETSSDCNIINTLDVPVVLMGGDNLVVAATSDGILVADKAKSSYIKKCLEKIDTAPRYEERRWGTIKTIERSVENGNGVCTNIVRVKEGQYTTYHRHILHDEIITVVSGEGMIIIDGSKQELKPGTAITIKRGTLHAIKALMRLKYLEVLIGDIDGDDIERVSFEPPI